MIIEYQLDHGPTGNRLLDSIFSSVTLSPLSDLLFHKALQDCGASVLVKYILAYNTELKGGVGTARRMMRTRTFRRAAVTILHCISDHRIDGKHVELHHMQCYVCSFD